jgi:hypothetical protein
VLRLSSEHAWSRAECASGSLRVIQARCAGRRRTAKPPAHPGVARPRNPSLPQSEAQPDGQRRSVTAERREPRSGALDGLGQSGAIEPLRNANQRQRFTYDYARRAQKKCVRARHVANPTRRIASPLSSNIACIRLNRHKGSSADESHGPWTDGRQRRVGGLCCGSERLRDLLGAALPAS